MNNRVVILEGPDCCGKSTLAERLVEQYGFHPIHLGKPEQGEDLFTTYTELLTSALYFDQPVVFDRLHIGECIYGPVMRGTDLLSPLGATLLNRIMMARDVKLVFCLPRVDTFRKNYLRRGDEYVSNLETAEVIYQMYDDYAKSVGTCFDTYDYEHHDTADVEQMLFNPAPTLPFGCTGSPMAKWLVVGDIVNKNVLQHDVPFHHLANSSLYLHKAMAGVKRDEQELAFTNTHHIAGGPRDLARIVERLPRFKRAVALGRKAATALDKAGLPFTYVEHPSSAKRFKHHQVAAYTKQLREALR